MTEIGGGWYVGKISKLLPSPRRPKIIKKHKRRRVKLKNYMRLISGGMIGNSNCIGTSLNGLIQEVKSKGKTPVQFLQKSFT